MTTPREELQIRLGRDEWDYFAASAWLLRHYSDRLAELAVGRFSPRTPEREALQKTADRIAEEICEMTSPKDVEIALGYWFVSRLPSSTEQPVEQPGAEGDGREHK